MSAYTPPIDDLRFVLEELADLDSSGFCHQALRVLEIREPGAVLITEGQWSMVSLFVPSLTRAR